MTGKRWRVVGFPWSSPCFYSDTGSGGRSI